MIGEPLSAGMTKRIITLLLVTVPAHISNRDGADGTNAGERILVIGLHTPAPTLLTAWRGEDHGRKKKSATEKKKESEKESKGHKQNFTTKAKRTEKDLHTKRIFPVWKCVENMAMCIHATINRFKIGG